MTIVIVTGSRGWPNGMALWHVLAQHKPTLVVHGGCPSGADLLAHNWCVQQDCDEHVLRAKWRPGKDQQLDKAAGPKRNRRMLLEYPGQLVLAFPYKDSPGTAHCMKTAESLGHPLEVYDVAGELIRRTGPRR